MPKASAKARAARKNILKRYSAPAPNKVPQELSCVNSGVTEVNEDDWDVLAIDMSELERNENRLVWSSGADQKMRYFYAGMSQQPLS